MAVTARSSDKPIYVTEWVASNGIVKREVYTQLGSNYIMKAPRGQTVKVPRSQVHESLDEAVRIATKLQTIKYKELLERTISLISESSNKIREDEKAF